MPDHTHVGRQYRAPGQRIDNDRVARFRKALAGEADVAEPGAVPPTYAAVYCSFPVLGQLFGDPELDINLAGLLHGEQSFTFHRSVAPGDVVDSYGQIRSVEQKRGMTFVRVDLGADLENNGGRILEGSSLLIIRGGAA